MLFLIVLPTAYKKVVVLTQTLSSLATDATTARFYDSIAALDVGEYLELDFIEMRSVVIRIQ